MSRGDVFPQGDCLVEAFTAPFALLVPSPVGVLLVRSVRDPVRRHPSADFALHLADHVQPDVRSPVFAIFQPEWVQIEINVFAGNDDENLRTISDNADIASSVGRDFRVEACVS